MSPSETSNIDGFLEHPEEAFNYFRSQGIPRVICEQKHMGSRAVVIACRDEQSALERFGIERESGIITTRTGRRFFEDLGLESALLGRLRNALDAANFWDEFQTSWVVLDCELMPWSAKAQGLLKSQYAAVGSAASAALPIVLDNVANAAARLSGHEGELLKELSEDFKRRHHSAQRFVDAYRSYCWAIHSLDDFKLAPFHLLATENRVHVQQNHEWHMQTLARMCAHDPKILLTTPYRIVDVTDPGQVAQATDWWADLTERGGEGMVVKPLDFISKGKKGLVQPAV
jgi:hypothetical protein